MSIKSSPLIDNNTSFQQQQPTSSDWLKDVEQAENATVDIIKTTSAILHLISTTPTPNEVDTIEDEEMSNAHVGKINDAVDQIFSHLNIIQYNLRKSFGFLSSEGISDLTPFRNDLYLEERQLDLSTRTLDVALAHIGAIQACFDTQDESPLSTDASISSSHEHQRIN